MKKAVCLVSGGMDSFVAAAIAQKQGYKIFCLSFDYGQRNNREILSARKIARFLKAEKHFLIPLDLSWSKSALVDRKRNLPQKINPGIPVTYVPARNTIFLSVALGLAESIRAQSIFIGVNAIDYSGYPDCRPEYIRRFQKLMNVATKTAIQGRKIILKAPLLFLSKAQIVKKGISLGLDFSLTWSCYRGGKKPCGKCASCLLRARGFQEVGICDPIIINNKSEK